jgi:predicted TIM-barrel fold metal-dependent hydrolase
VAIPTSSSAALAVFLAGWAVACTCRDATPAADANRFRKFDVHVHAAPEAIPALLRLMDAHGIDRAVNLSGGWPGMGLERSLAAGRSTSGRVVVFATPPLQLLSEGVTPAELAAQLPEVRALGARGVKVFKALGLSYRWPDGSLVAVDDARLDVFFEEAGRAGLPISIHTGDPKAFWLPVGPANERSDELTVHPSWSNAGKPLPSWETLYSAFLARVARHPNTTFIGVHFGNDPEDLDAVSAALEANPNLYVDTAARVPELGRHPDTLRALLARHPTRVLFGTDLGVGTMPGDLMLGSSGATPPTAQDVEHFFRATWRFFETRDEHFEHPTPIQGRWRISGAGLNRAELERLYSKNAEALLLR